MSESENEYWSEVDNISLHTKLIGSCLNMRTGIKGEHAHISNVRSNAKIKLQLSKTLEENKWSRPVSTRSSIEKQAVVFIIEFDSEFTDLK